MTVVTDFDFIAMFYSYFIEQIYSSKFYLVVLFKYGLKSLIGVVRNKFEFFTGFLFGVEKRKRRKTRRYIEKLLNITFSFNCGRFAKRAGTEGST